MKLKFDANLDFQKEAIASIVDIFEGQETCRTNFTVAPMPEMQLFDNDLGVGNKLELLDEDLLSNVKHIQLRNGLNLSKQIYPKNMDFTIEMETWS